MCSNYLRDSQSVLQSALLKEDAGAKEVSVIVVASGYMRASNNFERRQRELPTCGGRRSGCRCGYDRRVSHLLGNHVILRHSEFTGSYIIANKRYSKQCTEK